MGKFVNITPNGAPAVSCPAKEEITQKIQNHVASRQKFLITNQNRTAHKKVFWLERIAWAALGFTLTGLIISSLPLLVTLLISMFPIAFFGLVWVEKDRQNVTKEELQEFKKEITKYLDQNSQLSVILKPALEDIRENTLKTSWYEELLGMFSKWASLAPDNVDLAFERAVSGVKDSILVTDENSVSATQEKLVSLRSWKV